MTVLIIEGQGGKLGQQLVKAMRERFPKVALIAVGTNSIATAAMIKGGVAQAATGENAVCVACRRADIIVGPIGIVVADALLGEITPTMAQAVGQSTAKRVLLPMNRCDTLVAGVGPQSMTELVADALDKIAALIGETSC